jgi:hypothetical protein
MFAAQFLGEVTSHLQLAARANPIADRINRTRNSNRANLRRNGPQQLQVSSGRT